MKVKIECNTCESTVEVDRFCKIVDGRCKHIEGDEYWESDKRSGIKYCDLPCLSKSGPMLNNRQYKERKKKIELYEKRLEELQKVYKKKKKCKHPSDFVNTWHEYFYGDIDHYYCKVCGYKWRS